MASGYEKLDEALAQAGAGLRAARRGLAGASIVLTEHYQTVNDIREAHRDGQIDAMYDQVNFLLTQVRAMRRQARRHNERRTRELVETQQ